MNTAYELRALLSAFVASPWRDLYIRSDDWTVFMAKPDGAANPLRQGGAPLVVGVAITAPHLGLFTASCQPGDAIAAGAEVGRLEVLGVAEPVCAIDAGTVIDVLADDGALVEYDAPLIRVAA